MLAKLHPIILLLATTYAFDEKLLYETPPIAPRESWLARPNSRHRPDNVLPATEVVVMHTEGEQCATHGECVKTVRGIQTFYMDSLGLIDIPFNFLIGGDGVVYEGRGWFKEGEHTPGHNRGTIGIAFIGNFANEQPNLNQVAAFHGLMGMGKSLNLLSSDFNKVGQCQLVPSSSPGKGVMIMLTQGKHFNSSLTIHQCKGFDTDL